MGHRRYAKKYRLRISNLVPRPLVNENTSDMSINHRLRRPRPIGIMSGFRITYLLTHSLTYLQNDDKVAFASTKYEAETTTKSENKSTCGTVNMHLPPTSLTRLLIPVHTVSCGLSLLLVIALLRGLFSGLSGFPFSTITNSSKFQFDLDYNR